MTGGEWVNFGSDVVTGVLAGVAAGGFWAQLRANRRLLMVLDARSEDLADMAAVCSKLDPELLPRLLKRAHDLSEELRRRR